MSDATTTSRTVGVELGARSYDIIIGAGLIAQLGALVSAHLARKRVYVITDENVGRVHLPQVRAALEAVGVEVHPQVLPAGESTKNFTLLEAIIDAMMEKGADRKDVVIALGGGVIGDITGLAAGLLKRGMKFIQVPTTLLAQVDSSVGGKTAVNSKLGKNLIGLFNQPELVVADLDVLKTLPEREMRAGLAEVIKYGLIDDPDFFEFVEANADRLNAGEEDALAYAVQRSCESKARIVAEDETEQDKRALLNLGHTFAHALERANGFGPALLHGEAVGTGMAMAYRYSQALGICPGQDAARAARAIGALGLVTDLRELAGGPYVAAELLDHMRHDKKTYDGKLTLILARGIGQSFIEKQVDAAHLLTFLEAENRLTTMDLSLYGTPIAIVLLLAMSGFFSGSETALTAASRARMHALEKDGKPAAGRVNKLISDQEGLIGSILLGNNLVNILATSLATSYLLRVLGESGVAVATAAMTVLVLVFAEVLPKTYAINNADKFAMTVSGPVGLLVKLLKPLVMAVQFVVRGALALFGVKAEADPLAVLDEIRGAIDLHHEEGAVEAEDKHRLGGVLDLKELTVADIMIHRKSIRMIDVDLPPTEIVRQALDSPHTRHPLFRGDKEEVVGVLHAKDLLRAIAEASGEIESIDISKVATDPSFTPETTSLQDQLDTFLKTRSHFALVVDEYGALMGLVTLEDILEEIVGDIQDEHDIAVPGVRPQPDGSVFVDGWVPIRDLNRVMNWNLPDEEAVTVAGLVIHETQSIPEPGRRFTFHGYVFDILRKHRNQIMGLRVRQDDTVRQN